MFPTDATVLVVDDDPAVRRGVSRLARSAGFNVKTFASPLEFLDYPLPASPTCVLLDMCMEPLSGLEVQSALKQNARQVPIVFLSGRGTIPTATASIKEGAEDFLEKPARPRELIDAIGRAVERDRSRSADRSDLDGLRQHYESLTAREQQVMALVVSGMLNKQAAAELNISEKTIKVHRARVMEKMQVESLAALVRIAERLGVHAPVTSDMTAASD
jgi:FixJ family two-component response regulator